MASLIRSLAALALFLSSASALQVAPGSSCASVCLDRSSGDASDPKASSIKASDVVCNDVDYWSSSIGVKFRTCVECLQNSTKADSSESDTAWYLYNIRYAVDVCLFASSNSTQSGGSTPCALDQTCGPLRTALEAGPPSPSNGTEFGYCTADNNAFSGQTVSNCAQCFQATSGQKYLSNFIAALNIGCLQQPAPGTVLGVAGSLFTSTAISMVTPAANATSASAQSTTTMTTGTIVGIVVGAGLLFLGGVALLIVYWRRQRRFAREDDNAAGRPGKTSPSSYSSTITSHHHLPVYTTDYKGGLPPYHESHAAAPPQGEYESNAEYYDRMVDVLSTQRPSDLYPEAAPRDLSALPIHHAYVPRVASRAGRNDSPSRGTTTPPRNSQQPPPPAPQQQQQQPAQAAPAPAPIRESIRIPPPPPRPAALSSYPMPKSQAEPITRETTMPVAAAPAAPVPSSVSVSMPVPPPPPPPPPPARVTATTLIVPTVPRVRVPKKYTPPHIAVQEATPIEQPDRNISLPFSLREERFKRDGGEEGYIDHVDRARNKSLMLDRRTFRGRDGDYQELPIGSGKSMLYGI